MDKKVYPNDGISRILMGVPEDHSHLRTIIETNKGETLVFQEATIAALVRAYTDIKTHPRKTGVELALKELESTKTGYAPFQLMETKNSKRSIADKLKKIFPK